MSYTIPKPTPGRIVHYQTDGRNFDYYLPAIVVVTLDNLVDEAAQLGLIPHLSSASHVHLWVPGGKEPYYEYDVPFAPIRSEPQRRSWHYPVRVDELIEVEETWS